MSIYTLITHLELQSWLENYDCGNLKNFHGISAGVSNSNYFVDTTCGQFVLTIFESLDQGCVKDYMDLMNFLSESGVSVPRAIESRCHSLTMELKSKPAALVEKKAGMDYKDPTLDQTLAVAREMAKIHLLTVDYPVKIRNQRPFVWWLRTTEEMSHLLPSGVLEILRSELDLYRSQTEKMEDLPKSIIHFDLFRDNALFDENSVSAIIDFYYSCYDTQILDLAVFINDWATNDKGSYEERRISEILEAYDSIRTLTSHEKEMMPVAIRGAILRFWVSRLSDFYRPQRGELVVIKDPTHFENMLKNARSIDWPY